MSGHSHHSHQVSSDLVWEIARNQNSFLVKRKTGGGVRFSRDPLNPLNVHSRKYAGFVNDKAVGVVPAEGDKGGVTLITKKTKHTQRPRSNLNKITWGGDKSTRKTYKGISSNVAKNGYRGDLRASAVARASAIRQSQRPVKETPEPKLRGSKAKKDGADEA
ncbi:MAG: hypothetical protein M1818_000137 [Claussenomyces sp. TS43310]|nr:MAG: hypothetical protein M1818_000137 [Claussenomyces sp. TS43310]